MTRYTSIGRKRSYLEAGFSDDAPANAAGYSADDVADENVPTDVVGTAEGQTSPLPARKQKRTKQKQNELKKAGESSGRSLDDGRVEPAADAEEGSNVSQEVKDAYSSRSRDERRKKEAVKSARSEERRLKRKQENLASTTCFACREKGHAAKDCPKVKSDQGKRKAVTGICYRCGSSKHTLSRCRKAENAANPLPYASCYVCSEKGHLASSCPQNKEKGVYPNGGCCKLCGETSHLARNCPTREQANESGSLLVGTGGNAGADEDDFHLIRRANAEIDLEQKEAKRKKKVKAKMKGDHDAAKLNVGGTVLDVEPRVRPTSSMAPSTPNAGVKKKVVVF